jgi:beta-aspartyl-dipeptidase (metallo-type)
MLLIKNAELHAPEALGKRDILIAGGRIVAIEERIDGSVLPGSLRELDASGLLALPGLIDSHVHILGGGGEGGFSTRTPELQLGDCLAGGVTTVVGTLGTDGLARSMESLVAKAYALRESGLSCWLYTGSYRVPPRTVTGDAMKDIMMIEPIIGIGEVAVSDHRSSLPTIAELGRIAADARVGGMLSGKAGVVNFHLGDAPAGLGPLEELVSRGDMPRTQFIPTHCNRNPVLFAQAMRWVSAGGCLDLTTSGPPSSPDDGGLSAAASLKALFDAGIPFDRISCSSDGQGSLPVFGPGGELSGLALASSSSLWEAVREAILDYRVPMEAAVRTVSSSPASMLKLARKGRIAVGADADLVLVGRDLEMRTVIAGGRIAVEDGHALLRGLFEILG